MPQITIYSTPTCHFCHMAKDFLNEHNIAFENKDVSTDPAARMEMIEYSGQMGVPVIRIEGHEAPIIGFDEEELRKVLNITDDATPAAA